MKRLLLSIACFGLSLLALAQNTIALPGIVNLSNQTYQAGTQNWCILQDDQGMIYVGNNEGLLTYDGYRWQKFKVPNETILRSMAFGEHGRIYIGAQSEFGYFEPDNRGLLQYFSLTHLVPESHREFADVWNVVSVKDQVFFRSNKKIFQLNNGKLSVFTSVNWDFMGFANGRLIANEYEKGLVEFKNGYWVPMGLPEYFPKRAQVMSFVGLNADSILLATKKFGFYLLANNNMVPFRSADLDNISKQNIGMAIPINASEIAIATNLGGCYVVNASGKLVQKLTTGDGFQSNNVISLLLDNRKNLWLALDNGLDFVAYNNPIRHVYPDKQEHSSGYAAAVYDGSLYLGMGTGLFRTTITNAENIGLMPESFHRVPNSNGQVWNLSELNGKLLMGHNDGAFVVHGDQIQNVYTGTGFWQFQPLSNILPSGKVLAGTYNGLRVFDYHNGNFENHNLEVYFESARFIVIDNNLAWVAHPYIGIYKVMLHDGTKLTSSLYEDKNQLLSSNRNFVFKVKGRVVLCTDKGIFEYDHAKGDFVPSELLRGYFGKETVQYLKEDSGGNIWFIQDKRLGVIDLSGTSTQKIYIPELDRKMLTNGHDFIYPYNNANVFVASDNGFHLINYEAYKSGIATTPLIISSVVAQGPVDSLLYAGFAYTVASKNKDIIRQQSSLSYAFNNIAFHFASPLYGRQANVEYAYQLEGFDKAWSSWSGKTTKEYSYLPPGSYTFHVRARSHPDDKPVVRSYQFKILPPWYRTIWAWLLYVGTAAVLIYYLYGRQIKKFENQQKAHEKEQQRLQYLHQLELEKSESEIIRLQNEKLEAELQLKNKELAATTINLVQKGEIIHRIKDEFTRINKTTRENENPEDMKKLMRMLEPERVKQDWEQFAMHFNRVHDQFLIGIKKAYPNLTPTEIKLCAYLRLNISSKEIAHIMSITVKSVELSRYRLRKKLGLAPDENLFDFLLAIHETMKKEASLT